MCALAVTDKRDEATRERDAARAALAQLRFDQESQLEQLQQEHSMEVLTMLEGKDSAIGEGSAAFKAEGCIWRREKQDAKADRQSSI